MELNNESHDPIGPRLLSGNFYSYQDEYDSNCREEQKPNDINNEIITSTPYIAISNSVND